MKNNVKIKMIGTSIVLLIILMSTMSSFMQIKYVTAASCCGAYKCPTISCKNLKIIYNSKWFCYPCPKNCPRTIVRCRVIIYEACGLSTISGKKYLPIFVVVLGSVLARCCMYEYDSGCNGLNSKYSTTMTSSIDLIKYPACTCILCEKPTGFWAKCITGAITTTSQIGITYCGISAQASVSITNYVYRLYGEETSCTSPKYCQQWRWSLGVCGTNPAAHAEWTWAAVALIITPALNGNELVPASKLCIKSSVLGNFWNSDWWLEFSICPICLYQHHETIRTIIIC
ncbi:hypothetical protein DDW13_02255 [Acidianus hospitalis]|uniref:Uncharacterized protein n=1 Tax=Acidianus hospitalis TaxID=563177 RepID=A0A2T9X9G4_9CREN|nr:hypothetical protein DDW13_02255 [Acidianus hospitalis]